MSAESKIISDAELARQLGFCHEIKNIYERRLNRTPIACAHTFGCQQNEADTELIRGMLCDMGFGFTELEGEADLIIFNTCAIREHAEMRVFGNVGEMSHAKKVNPNLTIAICGCMAQQEHVAQKVRKSYPYVDILFGTHALYRFPELLLRNLTTKKRVFDREGSDDGVIIEGVKPIRAKGTAAWLSIMYGCNNFCSYCVVPYVRGRERSRSKAAVIKDFKALLEQGYRDITLLGQNVNSYGKDLENSCDFASLLQELDAITGDFRIRFMTSHPKDASNRLFDVMAESKHICHTIHLPVQAGSNEVLERMNRRYTVQKYMELVNYARSVMPDITMTSDIIVGFPGETEEQFDETIKLLELVRFDALFTFIYSKRHGTVAEKLPDPFTREQKQKRFDRLLETQNAISNELNAPCVGTIMRVLVDGTSEDERYPMAGRTEGFKLVRIRGGQELMGKFVNVKIEKHTTWALFGSAI